MRNNCNLLQYYYKLEAPEFSVIIFFPKCQHYKILTCHWAHTMSHINLTMEEMTASFSKFRSAVKVKF